MMHSSMTRNFTISLITGWLLIFGILPILLLVGTSVLEQDPVDLVRFRLSFEAYRQLMDPAYLDVLVRSLNLAAVTTGLCLLVGFPFAWWLGQMARQWRTPIMILLMIPFWTNSLVRTYAIRLVLGRNGLINTLLLSTGIVDTPIRFLYTDLAVILGLFYLMIPFMILPLYASIEKLDKRLLEASRDLGAGLRTTMVRVVWPLTLPGIVAGCIMVFVPTMGLFYVATLLGGARQLLVGNLIQQQFLNSRDWPLGSATSLLLIGLMAFLLAVYALIMKRIAQRMTGAS